MLWLLPLIIIAFVAPLLVAGVLLKQWSKQEAGIDIREEAMGAEDIKEDIDRFTPEQKTTLALLLTPPVLFLLMIIMFIAANIAVLD